MIVIDAFDNILNFDHITAIYIEENDGLYTIVASHTNGKKSHLTTPHDNYAVVETALEDIKVEITQKHYCVDPYPIFENAVKEVTQYET